MKKFIPTLLIISLPLLVAGTENSPGSIGKMIDSAFVTITVVLIPLVFVLCLLYFFWGLAKYIRMGATSEEAAKEGKKVMVWGVVGIFVAFSIWGIINLIQSELGIPPIENAGIPLVPDVRARLLPSGSNTQ